METHREETNKAERQEQRALSMTYVLPTFLLRPTPHDRIINWFGLSGRTNP